MGGHHRSNSSGCNNSIPQHRRILAPIALGGTSSEVSHFSTVQICREIGGEGVERVVIFGVAE